MEKESQDHLASRLLYYAGSGPAQLALAILLDYTGDAELAFVHHHAFKSQVIARLPRECGHWRLPAARIEAFLQERNVTRSSTLPAMTDLPQAPSETAAAEQQAAGPLVGAHAAAAAPVPEPVAPEPLVTEPIHDELFDYAGYYGCASRCRIRWVRRGNMVIVIVTELPDNPGTSVTNMAEHLVTAACRHYGFDPSRILWIEQYPDRRPLSKTQRDPIFEEHFDLVSFERQGTRFSRPTWTRITRQQVETLLGQPLPDQPLSDAS